MLHLKFQNNYNFNLVEVAWDQPRQMSNFDVKNIKILKDNFRKTSGETSYHFAYYGARSISQKPDLFFNVYRCDEDFKRIIVFCLTVAPETGCLVDVKFKKNTIITLTEFEKMCNNGE